MSTGISSKNISELTLMHITSNNGCKYTSYNIFAYKTKTNLKKKNQIANALQSHCNKRDVLPRCLIAFLSFIFLTQSGTRIILPHIKDSVKVQAE